MKYQVFALVTIVSLAGCGSFKSGSAEKTYLNAKAAASLQVPAEFADQTRLSPLYEVPEGELASADEKPVSTWPPQFIGRGLEDTKHKSAKAES